MCGFKAGCLGFVSGMTRLLLSGVPSSFLGLGPGLIASIVLIALKLRFQNNLFKIHKNNNIYINGTIFNNY